jgi:hypothetical protein
MWRCSLLFLLILNGLAAQPRDWIVFPHEYHIVEEELACSECHTGVEASVSLETRLLPGMDVCAACHEDDTEDGDCSLCHVNPDEPLSYEETQPLKIRDFSHQFHLGKGKTCRDCHGAVWQDDGTTPPRSWEQEDCRRCHLSAPPESHGLQWLTLHGLNVSDTGQPGCNLCHTVASCDQCHQLQQFEPRVHPVDYLFSHGFDVRSGRLECSTCHPAQETCYRCHRENGVMPLSHSQPAWVGQFLSGGGIHAEEALEEPDVCRTCHHPEEDLTCLRCHGEE